MGHFVVEFISQETIGKAIMSLMDITGKIIDSRTVQILEDVNNYFINATNYENGTYMISSKLRRNDSRY